MKVLASFLYIVTLTSFYPTTMATPFNAKLGSPGPGLIKHASELDFGTKYLIKSGFGKQDCYITVHKDGKVDSQNLIKNGDSSAISTHQLWSIASHPFKHDSFQLVQDEVPFNELSGFVNTGEYDPPLFPKQLSFTQVWDDKWQIQIRVRWCLRFLGRGNPMDIDDCEIEYEPEKLWTFIPVTKSTMKKI